MKEHGLYEDLAIIVTSDHGECMGELNVYGDHQTADLITNRVPMIIKWPGVSPRVDNGFHYQFDISATVIELLGGEVPERWDGESIRESFLKGEEEGRDQLILSQGPWSCQRSVLWKDHIMIKTYMDGLKEYPENMLFNWKEDPHELNDLAEGKPDVVQEGIGILEQWTEEMLESSFVDEDPMQGVIKEGGPWHTRGALPIYLDYYEKIGRPELARRMKERYLGINGYDK